MLHNKKSVRVDGKDEWEDVFNLARKHGYTWSTGDRVSLYDTYGERYSYIVLHAVDKEITVANSAVGVEYNHSQLRKLSYDLDEDEKEGEISMDEKVPDEPTKVNGQELIVFTVSGNTYNFNNVTGFSHTTTGFSFTYTGMSTGVTRFAEFDYKSTAGYALSDMKE